MRYIGSKSKLITQIEEFIEDCIPNYTSCSTFLDLFSGTGIVSRHLKTKFEVTTNDILYFAYILSKGHITLNNRPNFDGLRRVGVIDPIEHLNEIEEETGFISRNYSEQHSARMYFSTRNAQRIDAVRLKLDYWLMQGLITQDEFDYLLACLIEAVPFVANITGTYAAYLKHWDNRAFKRLTLKHPELINNNRCNQAFNLPAEQLAKKVIADIAYIDPPYNTRQYGSNYHLLETIAKYDDPIIKGVTGIRADTVSSDFCKKATAFQALERIVNNLNCSHIIISYNSDGILSKAEIEQILCKIGDASTLKFKSIDYRPYKSKKSATSSVEEYLFYIKKTCIVGELYRL